MKVRLTKTVSSAKFGVVLEPGIYEAEKLDSKRYRLDAGNSVSLIVISGVEELNPPPGKKWAKVADENVRHIWVCTSCKAKTKAIITPNWYENNGTPVCSGCDRDMTYSHTDWRYSDSKV